MSKALDPPATSAPLGEPAPTDPPTPYEHMLAARGGDVIAPCARRLARRFPRLVRDDGLMTPRRPRSPSATRRSTARLAPTT